jgi:hypothetical protein
MKHHLLGIGMFEKLNVHHLLLQAFANNIIG